MVSPARFRRMRCTVGGALIAALLLFALPANATVKAELDRGHITEGETVTLTFQSDDPDQGLDANLDALDADFEILDQRSESQFSIVGGRQTAVVRLLITLEPRHSGTLEIPSIDFGGQRTQALSLQVDPAPQLAPGELPPVFIEAEVTPAKGPYYVHAQLGLVVRVFYKQNLTEASLSPPDPSPASVRLLHETPFQADRGGQHYRVLERNYAIFPEHSGTLEIPAMELTGRMVESRGTGLWQPTIRGRRISVSSDPIKLNIEAKPPAFTGHDWQPARDYRISQQVSASDTLHVGEPVTRTVIIDAVGLEENMIVEPEWPDLQNARIYPDQPQGITRDDGKWVLGHKEFRYAVVPEVAGDLVLPELKVHWWDTINDREQSAVLPGKTLSVLPSALVPPASQGQPANTLADAPAGSPRANSAFALPTLWRWLALLFAVLWLATLLVWRHQRGAPARTGAAGPRSGDAETEDEALTLLRRACTRGEPAAARHALQAWLRDHPRGSAGGVSVLEFARGLDDEALRQGIYAMDGSGFQPADSSAWDGRAWWANFDAWRKRHVASAAAPAEPTDLYAPANRRQS